MKISEEEMIPEPGIKRKIKHSLNAVVFGTLLFQLFIFCLHYYLFFAHSIFIKIFPYVSVFRYWDNIFLIGYILVLAILGWRFGEVFSGWLKKKMSFLYQLLNI